MRKSGFPPAAVTIRVRSSAGTCSPISSSTASAGSGSSRTVTGHCGRRSASSGRAMQRSRIGDPEESRAVPSTRSRKVSSPHWMSSRKTTSGACSPSSLRNAHAICSAVVAGVGLAEQRADRRRCGRIGGKRVKLLEHLDHRPVRDPLAVGQTTARDDPHPERGQRFRDKPRLADAGLAHDRDQLAGAAFEDPHPRLDESVTSRHRDRRRATRAIAPAHRVPRRGGKPIRARSCLSVSSARPVRPRPPRGRGQASSARSGCRPGRPRSAAGRRR